jgi:ABC-type multidrug transport system fused ATPase/permease subunit
MIRLEKNDPQGTLGILRRLWLQLTQKRKRQVYIIFFLICLVSLLEMISVASIVPFLSVLTNGDEKTKEIISSFFFSDVEFSVNLGWLTVIFCFLIVLASAARLTLLWFTTRFSFRAGSDLSSAMYEIALNQPYQVHISKNSSEVISSIYGKTQDAIGFITIFLNIVSSIVILIGIVFVLLYINPLPSILSFLGFGIIYTLISVLTRKRLRSNSVAISHNSTVVIKALQEGLNGVRDILLDRSQKTYIRIYATADRSLKQAQANNAYIGASPRYLVEALGTVLLAALSLYLFSRFETTSTIVPTLGLIAMGAQRLLPLLQNLYAGWSSMQGGYSSVLDVLELLERPTLCNNSDTGEVIQFNKVVRLSGLSFRYGPDLPYVIENLTFEFTKGSRIGFIGTTGCGKTTLMDIVMGLLVPTSGHLEVDGKKLSERDYGSWQTNLAHVPQSIYLADSTVAENIAFGIEKCDIDMIRVANAARRARISDDVSSWRAGYETIVGERGVRLSGGQRQRIGIARALYREPSIIIFDEATSALDTDTEQEVMNSINSLDSDITVLLIAHRQSTLKGCSQIYKISNGRLIGVK